MTKKQAELIVDFLWNGSYESEVYEGYSGRGMYGEQTTGVSYGGGLIDFVQMVGTWMEDMDDMDEVVEVGRALKNLRWDNLGMGIILY